MTNIEIIKETNEIDGSVKEHIIIRNEDGSMTCMLKSIYEELEAAKEQSGTL